MPELSVITVAYNSQSVLDGFFEATDRAAPGAEIVVVDNGSDHATLDLIKGRRDVRLVEAGANIGFGRGCNLGAAAARGNWLLFANPDMRISTVELPGLRRGERFGVGAGHIGDRGGDIGSGVRAEPTLAEDWLREVVARFLPRRLNAIPSTRRNPPGWAYGALTLVRADEFHAIGGFDDRFFLYHEDRDLGARYRSHAMPIRDLPMLAGHHLKGQSVKDGSNLAAEGWAFVSWIEYLSIWRGRETALLTARNALRLLRMMSWSCSKAVGSKRAQNKAAAAQTIAAHVLGFDSRLPAEPAGFYPGARAILQHVAPR